MSGFFENIKSGYSKGDMLLRLIYINGGMFLLLNLFVIAFRLFNIDLAALMDYVAVPSDTSVLITRIWTPITYMFFHKGFMHLLFNMLMLYWFGKIFRIFFSDKQLLALYVFGGLAGALAYVFSYNFFPYYEEHYLHSTLIGASASIMAIVAASAAKSPNMEMNLLLIGRVKILYIAIAAVLISVFGMTGDNAGGELSHIGGALAGYLFFMLEKKGKDITPFFNRIFDFFATLFRPAQKTKTKTYHTQKMSDEDFNSRKAANEEEINRILDKIKKSGYESLSSEEKKRLFDQKR